MLYCEQLPRLQKVCEASHQSFRVSYQAGCAWKTLPGGLECSCTPCSTRLARSALKKQAHTQDHGTCLLCLASDYDGSEIR